jgi:N utilization substance protein B
MGVRRRGRELAFQVLFQMDLGREGLDYAVEHFLDLKTANKDAAAFAVELATGAGSALKEIDARISAISKNWDFKRLNSVDRALMRLGAHEILSRPDIPAEVTINECVELAKAYGSEESPAFVNGILDQIHKESAEKAETSPKRPSRPRKRAGK